MKRTALLVLLVLAACESPQPNWSEPLYDSEGRPQGYAQPHSSGGGGLWQSLASGGLGYMLGRMTSRPPAPDYRQQAPQAYAPPPQAPPSHAPAPAYNEPRPAPARPRYARPGYSQPASPKPAAPSYQRPSRGYSRPGYGGRR